MRVVARGLRGLFSAGILGRMGSAGRDYALGAFFIVLAVLAMIFLDGSTSVFVCIAAALAGTVMFIRGAQIEHFAEDPMAVEEYGIPGPRGEVYDARREGPLTLENYDSDAGSVSGYDGGIDSGFDWDAHYKREFGGEQGGSRPAK